MEVDSSFYGLAIRKKLLGSCWCYSRRGVAKRGLCGLLEACKTLVVNAVTGSCVGSILVPLW
jgi:hypothetical protein